MKLEILVTTMNKTEEQIIALFRKMNLQGPAIFGNQCGKDGRVVMLIDGQPVKIINQSNLGVSNNRNAILKEATAEWVIFMDDDVTMIKDYWETIEDNLVHHRHATSIRFNMITDNVIRPIRQHGGGISTYRDVISYGVWGLLLNRERIIKKGLWFNPDFGPGARFYCGEDSMFSSRLMLTTGRNYLAKAVLGHVDQTESTWYKRHDKKFFISQGAMYYHLGGPLSRWFFIKVMLKKHRPYIDIPMEEAEKYLKEGIRQAKELKRELKKH